MKFREVLIVPESKEHRICKEVLALTTNCRPETYITSTRRADVACSEKLFFEIDCKKEPSRERVCYIEPRIKIGKDEYQLGKLSCSNLVNLILRQPKFSEVSSA
jgi:hypothetical protein